MGQQEADEKHENAHQDISWDKSARLFGNIIGKGGHGYIADDGIVLAADGVVGAPLGSEGPVADGDIRRTSRQDCRLFAVHIGFSGFMPVRMVEPQAFRIIYGDNINIREIFRKKIQLPPDGLVRISQLQHGRDLIHGRDIRGGRL